MTHSQPRLVVITGVGSPDRDRIEALRDAFDVVEVPDAEAADRELAEGGFLLQSVEAEASGLPGGALRLASAMMQHIGEGVGRVNARGELVWADRRLAKYSKRARDRFTQVCREAIDEYNQTPNAARRLRRLPARKFAFSSGKTHYELIVSPDTVDRDDPRRIGAVVGVVWEVTETRALQRKISAIDRAGSELMHIEAATVAQLDMAQRLKLLEEKIVRFVNELLNFDNFEIRLLDRETGLLELVIAKGIAPLKIGEVIYASKEGNGISGYVAVTGKSYICPDVRRDPLYREGLDNAASSLTVPLRLHDRVIGVFNIESYTANAFDENDRLFAEIFGRYIAMAMNILDLMVVERFTTNEQVAENVLGELAEPLAHLTRQAVALKGGKLPDDMRRRVDRIIDDAADIRHRIEACTGGPKTILGAEQEMRRYEPDPVMVGRRVLVADNEDNIRKTLTMILTQKGCIVTSCTSGTDTIKALRETAGEQFFDLVISDIKMPDRTGYEVFRATKEINPHTPVILMTGFGYDPHHSIVRASQEGLHALLFKPFQAGQLLELINRAFTASADRSAN